MNSTTDYGNIVLVKGGQGLDEYMSNMLFDILSDFKPNINVCIAGSYPMWIYMNILDSINGTKNVNWRPTDVDVFCIGNKLCAAELCGDFFFRKCDTDTTLSKENNRNFTVKLRNLNYPHISFVDVQRVKNLAGLFECFDIRACRVALIKTDDGWQFVFGKGAAKDIEMKTTVVEANLLVTKVVEKHAFHFDRMLERVKKLRNEASKL